MNIPCTEEDVNYLFHVLGQAVWYLLHLEKVMTTFNAFKILQRKRDKKIKITQKMAQKVLDKQRRQTLGPLIGTAKREKTIPKKLMDRFDDFLEERNWIIHKCVVDEYLSLRNVNSKNKLFRRIERFVDEAKALRREIHNLMESWYVISGYDLDDAYSLAKQMLKNAEKS
ncbi:MAG: hypothetical protein ACXQTP_05485 [Candidatus Methanofastidiosia archaeon]